MGRELHKYAGKRSRSETSFYSLQLDRPPAAVLERLIRFYGPPRESYDRNCVNLSFSRELETSVGSERKKEKKKRKRSRREDLEEPLAFLFSHLLFRPLFRFRIVNSTMLYTCSVSAYNFRSFHPASHCVPVESVSPEI